MRLTDEEKAMLAGDMGSHVQWAMDHQIKIGNFFDATDMVPVSQAHMMADPESFGAAGAARSWRQSPKTAARWSFR